MIGGRKDAVDHLDPIFSALAPGLGDIPRTPGREKGDPRAERGYIHAGAPGARRPMLAKRQRRRREKLVMSRVLKCSAVISDVDGTLVTAEKVLTTRAVAAVSGVAGGRNRFRDHQRPAAARHGAMLIDPLALRTLIAGFNGAIFVKPDMSIMADHVLAADVAGRALEVILRHGMDAWVYSGKDWLVRDASAPHVAREIKFAPTVVENFKDPLGRAVKIVGVSDDHDLVARCEKDAQDALGAKASAARSQPYYLDVTHPDANKGTVVTPLSKLLAVPADEIATIGDMPNDVLMFHHSGLSIAMGNASPEVQAQADLVTDSYDDEGFAKAMERFILHRAGAALPRASCAARPTWQLPSAPRPSSARLSLPSACR
jgi:Cof subfamily protein (haloacid dehalogenase superfamily)